MFPLPLYKLQLWPFTIVQPRIIFTEFVLQRLCKYNEKELFSMKAFHKCPAKDHHLRMRLNVLAPLFDVRAQNQQRGFFGLYLSI